jgi:phospholipase C
VSGLAEIKHLVVLMMENRSFDHMLGYLKADGRLATEVDGLDPATHGNPWPDGEWEPVRPMDGRFLHHKVQDPGHSGSDVKAQLAGGMQGFLRNYVEVLARNKERWVKDKKGRLPPDDQLWENAVLGYQQAHEVPVYDWIARNFVVCDRWFSSVAGPTWPNRMYAMTGGPGIADETLGLPGWLPGFMKTKVKQAPFYKSRAFPRWLEKDQWRWYSHDPATLRAADTAFRPRGEGKNRDEVFSTDANFAYFSRPTLLESTTFLDDCARGTLPEGVSWIDPNFVDVRVLGPPGSNDDHPPSRVILGQELVLSILLALARNPEVWRHCALLITYDEHGGFYDHVDPADYPCAADPTGHRYGVRVPTLLVSPYADNTVSSTVFSHTSIPKTILERFGDDRSRDEAYEAMGARTSGANHIGDLLSRDEPRDAPLKELDALRTTFERIKSRIYTKGYAEDPTVAERAFGFVSDLQHEIIIQAAVLRDDGDDERDDLPPGMNLPPGKP